MQNIQNLGSLGKYTPWNFEMGLTELELGQVGL